MPPFCLAFVLIMSMERALLHLPLRPTPYCNPSSPIWVPPHSPSSSAGVLPLPKVSIRCCYLESINDQIVAHLKKAIPIRLPHAVFDPMCRLTFSAPRSAAPALCVAACELVGGDRDRAIPAAAALHIMHAASYFREHLPLSDGPMSQLKHTISHEFGPNIKLLMWDAMVPFGLELITQSDNPAHDNPDLILQVIIEITHAIGSQGIIHGQYLHAKCARPGHDECEANLADAIREKKWGGLHGCAGACGAILGGGSEAKIEKLRMYGAYVGILRGMLNEFQTGEGHDWKAIEEVKNKAIRELEEINGAKVGPIMTLLDYAISNAVVTFA